MGSIIQEICPDVTGYNKIATAKVMIEILW